jgi:hypothetical protein
MLERCMNGDGNFFLGRKVGKHSPAYQHICKKNAAKAFGTITWFKLFRLQPSQNHLYSYFKKNIRNRPKRA